MKNVLLVLISVFLIVSTPLWARPLFTQTEDEVENIVRSAPIRTQSVRKEKPPAEIKYLLQTFNLNFINAKDIAETLKSVLTIGEAVSFNESLNSIVIRGQSKSMPEISKIIEKMDKPPTQIYVEAKIIELKSGNGDNTSPSSFGLNWQYFKQPGGNDFAQFLTTSSPTMGALSQGLYAQLLTNNVSTFLSALEKRSGFDSIASPSITALNHQQAEILIGGKLGYKTLLSTTTGVLQQVDYLEVGTKLQFTPHISSDGYIRMSIYPSLSDGVLIDGIPQKTTTETKNQVLVKDGQTIVIGGLTKNYSNNVDVGVPILSRIPIFGAFFRNTELRTEKRELMVLITPHIITPQFLEAMARKAGELENKTQQEYEDARLIH